LQKALDLDVDKEADRRFAEIKR